jgi:HAD-hyrolase-like
VHGPEKAEVLRSLRAAAYVGDTRPDIAAGLSAGVRAIGVATGSFTAVELRHAVDRGVIHSLVHSVIATYPQARTPTGGCGGAAAHQRLRATAHDRGDLPVSLGPGSGPHSCCHLRSQASR